MIAVCLVVSDKNIFENCILKTYFFTQSPTYATNWNNLNNFGRGPPRDHSNERFQRRRCLSKTFTHDGRRRTSDKGLLQQLTLSTLCSGELKKWNKLSTKLYFTMQRTLSVSKKALNHNFVYTCIYISVLLHQYVL